MHNIIIPFLIVISGFLCLEYMIPVAIGEFFAGIIGQSFFEFEDVGWLHYMSELGVVSLMFLAGFEIDVPILKKNLGKSLICGMTSFFLPFVLIFFSCKAMGTETSTAMIMGVSLSTTSLAIIFPTLREKGLLNKNSGQLILSTAMVVDIISMLMLALVIYEVTTKKILMAVAVIVSIIIIKKIVYPVFERYKGNRSEFELKFLLLLILSIGFMAEEAGVHAALICFGLGVLFSGIDPSHEVIIDKLNSVVFSLLAPAFFFQAGTMVHLTEINTTIMRYFVIFFSLSFIGKFLGTYLPLRFIAKDVARYSGMIFNYRLSFGIIANIYGYEKNYITKDMFISVLLIILSSSILVAILDKKFNITKIKKYA